MLTLSSFTVHMDSVSEEGGGNGNRRSDRAVSVAGEPVTCILCEAFSAMRGVTSASVLPTGRMSTVPQGGWWQHCRCAAILWYWQFRGWLLSMLWLSLLPSVISSITQPGKPLPPASAEKTHKPHHPPSFDSQWKDVGKKPKTCSNLCPPSPQISSFFYTLSIKSISPERESVLMWAS